MSYTEAPLYKDLDWVIAKRLDLFKGHGLNTVIIYGQILIGGWASEDPRYYYVIPLIQMDSNYDLIPEGILEPYAVSVKVLREDVSPVFKPSSKELVATKNAIVRKQIVKTLDRLPEELASRIAAFVV